MQDEANQQKSSKEQVKKFTEDINEEDKLRGQSRVKEAPTVTIESQDESLHRDSITPSPRIEQQEGQLNEPEKE